ncbi:L,D-transpeptidase [Bailinhaonella thermotolerans]|uniref:L,D-transpeptidase n=1 Tax=Bailinhaonella thermotolerans TaxID=1070861 RepID=UPI001F5B0792|nr:Ig-like domain-containing protein [Bailinhaonella thermotolerans]
MAGIPLLLSACSGGGGKSGGGGIGPVKKEPAPATVAIAPVNGAKKVLPDKGITVSAQGGRLQSVKVQGKGAKKGGLMSDDKTRWRSEWNLHPSSTYTVTATAVNEAGKTTEVTSTFSTLKPSKTFGIADITPSQGETVGVGMPIMVRFDAPVHNRAEVEKALEVQMSKPVEGAWHWFDNQRVDFRTKHYWPKNTKVKFMAHLAGVRGAKGTYATKDYVREFKVGRSQISTVDTRSHYMTVKRDGKVIRKIPISAGSGAKYKWITTNGKHLAMEKSYHVVMDSSTLGCPKGCPDYYRLDVYYTVKFSDSGEYVHGAPWSVGSQGRANVSHGCINASTENAKWFMNTTLRGDPINVTGTRRPLEHMNGWAHWEISWKNWVKGSALKTSVKPGDNVTPTPEKTPERSDTIATPTATGSPGA